MGPGFGLILSYAVYTQPKSDITLYDGHTGVIRYSSRDHRIDSHLLLFCLLPSVRKLHIEVMASEVGCSFIALPNLFATMDGGYVLGICFFMALFMAVLTSNFGHIAVVSLAIQELRISKKKAVWYTGVVTCIIGIPSTWSIDSDHTRYDFI